MMNSPSRILVVEDEAVVSLDLRERLTTMGYQMVGAAESGEKALELVRQHRPDLVLMDIRLRGNIDGVAAAKEIRDRYHLPVIFLSAYSEDSTLERARLAEPYGYLLKPFDNRGLRSAIEIALYKHNAEKEILRLNRLYDVLSQVNQTILRLKSREDLLPVVCRILVERGAIDLAWIGWFDEGTSRIAPIAHFGKHSGILDEPGFYTDERPEGQGNPGKAVREGKSFVCNDCRSVTCSYPEGKGPASIGFQSCGAFPLQFQGRVCGALVLHVVEPGFFQEREVELLEEVALDISFALDKLESDARRERAEAALIAERTRLRTLINTLPATVWLVDPQGAYLAANPAFERFMGVKEVELLGKTDHDFFPAELAEFFRGHDRNAVLAGKPTCNEEWVTIAEDGSRALLETIKTPMVDDNGQLVGVLGIAHDITIMRQAGEALAESEKFKNAIIDSMPSHIAVLNRKGIIVAVNAPWVRFAMENSPAEGFPARHTESGVDYLAVCRNSTGESSEVAMAAHDGILAVLDGRLPSFSLEYPCHSPNGERWFDMTVVPLGTPERGAVVSHLDITARRRIEEELRYKNSLLTTQQEASIDGIFVVDQQNIIASFNQRFVELFQVPGELIEKRDGSPVLQWVASLMADPDGFMALVRHLYEHQEARCREEIALKDGRIVDRYTSPCVGSDGSYYGRIWFFRDITEVKQGEAALCESEERFATVFRNSPVAIGISRITDGLLMDVNDAFLRLSGYPREEVIGRTPIELGMWVEPQERGRFIEMLYKEARVQHFHMKFRRRSGEIVDSMISAERVELVGEPYMVSFLSDISHLKQAEEALRQRLQLQEQFSRVSASVPGVVFSYCLNQDGSSRFPFATRAVEGLLGLSQDLLAEDCSLLFAHVHVDDLGPLKDSIAESARTLSPWHSQVRYLHPVKELRWIEGWSIPRVEADGCIVWHGFLTDITEHKQVELERAMAEAKLRQAQKMEALGTLAGGIAHDFNNILGIIIGYCEMAQEDADDSALVQENLGEILNGALRARDLVQQILAFSRQVEHEKKPVQVGLIVKEALKMLRASLPSTIEISQNIASKAVVMADPTQIHQVLMNLCMNAAHAMAGKPGVLEVSLTNVSFGPEAAPPHLGLSAEPHLRLTVRDTGKGIDPAVLDRIFEPFFTTKKPGAGTGLGLSVVHGIVESFGGTIHVESTPGKGSTFDVFLPAFEVSERAHAEEEAPLPGGRERILLVDDEPVLARATKTMLEHLGYQVDYRTNGVEALEAVRHQSPGRPYDLVITDMTMPHLTGVDLARELLKLEPHPLILLCTGFSEKIDAKRARSLGIHGFLAKPVIRKELAVMVRKLLDGRGEMN